MRASEVLRGLADLIDGLSTERTESSGSNIIQPVSSVAIDSQSDAQKTTMVPPLQQKIELLKKSLSVDNAFDQGLDQIDQEERNEHEVDEIEGLKKRAGINNLKIARQELADDEPTEA